jgi:ABC-2 type transport system permease protein
VSARATLSTTLRVLRQLRRDPRTVALLLFVPVFLLVVIRWIFDAQPTVFQRIGLPMVGVFPLVSMFLVSSITMLRERTSGTLERLMTLPIAKIDLVGGYAIAFALFAAAQTLIVAFVALALLDLQVSGPLWAVLAFAVLNAAHGMAFGLFLSAFAQSEFQAVQFMPAFLLPQILLSGLLAPRAHMAPVLAAISNWLPMTYAFDALDRLAHLDGLSGRLGVDALVLVGTTLLALVLGAATLRRRTG